jgi:hypothetical protein
MQQQLTLSQEEAPMRTDCSVDLSGFAPVEGRRVEANFDGGSISRNRGGLLLERPAVRSGWSTGSPDAFGTIVGRS